MMHCNGNTVMKSRPCSAGLGNTRHSNRMFPSHRLVRAVASDSTSTDNRTEALRLLLKLPGLLKGPACYDGLSAKLIEQAGFPFAFMSGFGVAAARIGAPDTGLLSYGEVLDAGRALVEATSHIPIIADADTGYGNALNVQRTVRGVAAAGFSGVLLEDQQWPKSCGHVRNKRVVDRGEAITRISAAVQARDAGADVVLVARTDARQAESFEEALWRAQAFADAGADVLFIDALQSVEEMERFCAIAPGVPKMASMLEGGGKTPICTPAQLESMGFKLVAYPLSLLGVSIAAQQAALQGLKAGKVPGPDTMVSFSEIQRIVGFDAYFEAADAFAAQAAAVGNASGVEETQEAHVGAAAASLQQDTAATGGLENNSSTTTSTAAENDDNAIEADEIIAPAPLRGSSSSNSSSNQQSSTTAIEDQLRRAKFFRLRIEDSTNGKTKLETRFPAGFFSQLATFVPEVAGLRLEDLIASVRGKDSWSPDQPVLDFEAGGGDRVLLYLEDNGA